MNLAFGLNTITVTVTDLAGNVSSCSTTITVYTSICGAKFYDANVNGSWDSGEPPLSETAESYDVEIMSGVTVLRTLTAATPSVLYTAAMQTADFGVLLTLGSSLTLRIYQKSARLGRGPALTKTLFF